MNEATSLNMSISARYARKYGTKNSGGAVSGSHTSRILGTKSKKINDLTPDQKTSSVNALEASCYANLEESTPRNYRIKIKRPKSAFFASASSSSSSTVSSNTSKPNHSPSPPPVVLRSNEIIINPKSAGKKAAATTSRHYFYTKEEIADYNDHVALNQLFMSKTCQSFSLANADLSGKPKTHRSANSNKATFFSRPR